MTEFELKHGLSQDEPGPLEPVEIAQQPGAAPATGNTARDQEMYVAGIRTGEENTKHNAAIRAGVPGASTAEEKPAAIDWAAVSACIAEFAEEYELRGEDDHGREGVYTPNETERGLIIDAIHWLLADDKFMALMRRPAPAPAAGDALALLDHSLLRDVLGYVEDAGPADVWGAAQSWMSLRDAAIAAVHPPPAAGDAQTAAARDVLAERQRQINVEGWTPEHDDQYTAGDMAAAAACYANQGRYHYPEPGLPGPKWPWAAEWWKPSTYRRNLEKAGALILAEIERLDRAAQRKGDA
nr:hypothetical protein [Achromobacter ruhlandii]